MSDLSLAQGHAWSLARTLMTTVILFQIGAENYGVLPEDELEGDEVEALYIYDPYSGGRSVH
ncbi:hypothetical protein [Mesorhizobium sp. BHbdii]